MASQMILAGWRCMTVSEEWQSAFLRFWPSVGSRGDRVQAEMELSCFRSVSRRRRHAGDEANRLALALSENKIVAVIPALPEPFAVLALVQRRIEFSDRQQPVAADEATLIALAFEPGENILHMAGREMAVFAFEHQ